MQTLFYVTLNLKNSIFYSNLYLIKDDTDILMFLAQNSVPRYTKLQCTLLAIFSKQCTMHKRCTFEYPSWTNLGLNCPAWSYGRIKENRIYIIVEFSQSFGMNFVSPFQPEREFKVYKSCKCLQIMCSRVH